MAKHSSQNPGTPRDARTVALDSAPLIVLLAVLVFTHLVMNVATGDYHDFLGFLDSRNLVEFTIWRFQTWTSRNILELATVLLVHVPWLWAILDIGTSVLVFWSLEHIFNRGGSRLRSWVTVALILSYPYLDMHSAGWIPTTVGYTWTLACGLFAFTAFPRVLYGERIPAGELVILLLATVFATNDEQLAAVVVGASTVVAVVCIVRSRQVLVPALFAVVGAAEMAVALVCPGNAARSAANAAYWLPEFTDFSTAHKIYLGFADTMGRYLFRGNALFVILAVMIVLLVFVRTTSVIARVVSVVPLAAVAYGNLATLAATKWPSLATRLLLNPDLQAGEKSIWVLLIEVTVIVCLVVSIVVIYGASLDLLLNFVIAAGGLGSRVIMGFSPSLFASSDRTFIYMDFAIVMLVLYGVMTHADEIAPKTRKCLFAALMLASAACAVSTVASIAALS